MEREEKSNMSMKSINDFSEETLSEMAMENVEGVTDFNINIPCNTNSGNCIAGCACSGGGYY